MDLLTATLLGLLTVAVIEILRLRRRHHAVLSREALVEAHHAVIQERSALEEAKAKQAFDEGVLEGMRKASQERDKDETYQLGYERGVLEGRRLAEEDFHLEAWTEVKKNQGYFFTSAEIHACYQLMYKGLPVGAPQRHPVEKSETVDRAALNEMVNKVMGEASLGPAVTARGIRIVNRDDETEPGPRRLASGKRKA